MRIVSALRIEVGMSVTRIVKDAMRNDLSVMRIAMVVLKTGDTWAHLWKIVMAGLTMSHFMILIGDRVETCIQWIHTEECLIHLVGQWTCTGGQWIHMVDHCLCGLRIAIMGDRQS